MVSIQNHLSYQEPGRSPTNEKKTTDIHTEMIQMLESSDQYLKQPLNFIELHCFIEQLRTCLKEMKNRRSQQKNR